MKKVMISLTILLFIFLYDYTFLNDTSFNSYRKYIKKIEYKIINNANYLKENNTKDLYSDKFKIFEEDIVNNKEELINLYYTVINKGYENYTYYCNYDKCFDDINSLSEDNEKISYINQLVNIYNNYNTIETIYSSDKRVDLTIHKKYSSDDIQKINDKIDEIINEYNINEYPNVTDKIKIFHDYLANTNTYDQDMAENKESEYKSDSAIGTLFEGKSICSGYTDTMAIFLDKIGLDNIKVSTLDHVWNAVKIDNIWYHLDLTWDDPVTPNNDNIILYDYFLKTTSELSTIDQDGHKFNKEIYNFIK